MDDIKTLSETTIYQNRWLKLREDKIRRKSGAESIYTVVEKPDFVAILAIDNGMIHLVEQFRYPIKKRCWELPQGAWESNPNVDPAELAAGELREETGMIAGKMTYVGPQYLAYGFCNQVYHIYLATELTKGEQDLDVEEEDLITRAFPLEQFEQMILNGEIMDATSVNAYGLAKLKGLI